MIKLGKTYKKLLDEIPVDNTKGFLVPRVIGKTAPKFVIHSTHAFDCFTEATLQFVKKVPYVLGQNCH